MPESCGFVENSQDWTYLNSFLSLGRKGPKLSKLGVL